MARGWESKSVESQIESAGSKGAEAAPHLTQEQAAKQSERKSLELSRTRVLHDLESATHPRHKAQLQAALDFLDRKIADLG